MCKSHQRPERHYRKDRILHWIDLIRDQLFAIYQRPTIGQQPGFRHLVFSLRRLNGVLPPYVVSACSKQSRSCMGPECPQPPGQLKR